MFSKASIAAWTKQQQHFRRAAPGPQWCSEEAVVSNANHWEHELLEQGLAWAEGSIYDMDTNIHIYTHTCCLKVKHVNKKRRCFPDLKMSSPQNDPSCSAKAGHSAGDLSSMLLFAFRRILAQLSTSEKPFVHRWNTSNSCDPTCTQKVRLGNNLRGASRKLTGVKVFGKSS